jgi:acyl carrier protein
MNRAVIDYKLREAIIKKLGVGEDKIFPDSRFADDMGADSIDMFELYLELETEFDLDDIDDYLRSKIKTFCDLGDCVESIVNAGKIK